VIPSPSREKAQGRKGNRKDVGARERTDAHVQPGRVLKLHQKQMISSLAKTVHTAQQGRAVWGVGLGRLDTEIVGSNPAQSMDVSPYLPVSCCPV
jgi:hypothetical protein